MSFPEAELARGAELDGAGFLPRRGESAEQFFRRVETILGIHREFEAELAAAGEVGVYGLQLRSQDRIPDEIIGEAEEVTDRLYSFRTRHVPGFFLSRDVGLLWGGCMICDPDHPLSVFLIRGAFRKRQRWLFYNRRELLAHELCHSMRQSLEEITLEEYFAYQTSPSRLRRYLGNCFIREYDAIWFVIPALLLLLGVSILLARWATRPVAQAWQQQRQFLSDASHELKTPLTVILSNAELLEAAPLEDRPARWADNIRSEAGQMKSLVEEMLTLARADNAVPTAVMGEVSLSDLATDCVLAFEPVAFEAGKPLESDITPDVTVTGDADKLRQLIGVLLDNAIKYGQAGGTISLTLRRTDRQARLLVSNPGDPIPPDQLGRLFERFYRADASRGEQSGFGLGLPIAASIATEHKGTLKAESDQASTRFLFSMPLKK